MAHPGLSVIISNMKSDKSGQNPQAKQSKLKELLMADESMEGEEEKGFELAMTDFIEAVKNCDVKLAMEAYVDLCKLCPEKADHEDDEDYISNDDAHSGGVMED